MIASAVIFGVLLLGFVFPSSAISIIFATISTTADDVVIASSASLRLPPRENAYSGYACENGYVNGSVLSRNMDFCKMIRKNEFWENEYYVGKYLAGENATCHLLEKGVETAYRNVESNTRIKVWLGRCGSQHVVATMYGLNLNSSIISVSSIQQYVVLIRTIG